MIMTRILTISAFALSALALAGTAQSALARTAAATATSASTAEGERKARRANDSHNNKQICISMIPDTASRVARQICKTPGEWAAEGIDITAKK
jgi:guanyl-specific ribonuclease Sa